MNEPDRFSSGEVLSAQKLNEVFDYARPPYAGVPASGSHIFGSQSANASLGPQTESVILVYATEDFVNQTTDSGIVDDVPSGLCDFVRLNRPTNMHVNQSGRPFYVHDVLAELSNGTPKLADEIFYAVWNHDSKRWEALSGSGIRLQAAHVIRCLGRGWHEIELCNWDGRPLFPDSFSVSDSLSESCENDLEGGEPGTPGFFGHSHCRMPCEYEPCQTFDGNSVPMDDCLQAGEQIHYPLYAHTTRQLPMMTGGLIKVIRRFGTPDDVIDLSDSVSASASEDEPWYYDVVDGVWAIASLPMDTYTKCVNPVTGECTVIRVIQQNVLFEGYYCPAVPDQECDGVASGSESAS